MLRSLEGLTRDPFAFRTPGIGDETAVGGNIPASERLTPRLGMFGNPRAAAMVAGPEVESGAGISPGGPTPISLVPTEAMPIQAAPLPSVQPLPGVASKKPGFFDRGGGWVDAIGILGDALAGAAGQAPIYTQMKLAHQRIQQETDRRLAEARARQAAEREEWLWRENWKQAHPDDQFTQFMIAGGIDPQSEQGKMLYRQRAEGMAAPPLMAVDGFDAQGNPTKTFMPRPTLAPSSPAVTSGPTVGTVRNGFRFKGGNPNDRSNWEQMGGAPSQGGGTFRDPMTAPGRMTSGRRTAEGNRLVGGVPRSAHLSGDAADYVGVTAGELRSYFGPSAKIIDEGDHIHVEQRGYGRTPYYGHRGTVGAR